MTLSELTIGDSFCFTRFPKERFIIVGFCYSKGIAKYGKCIPDGKLYPIYFKTIYEVKKLIY
jgi:hypothetical protein